MVTIEFVVVKCMFLPDHRFLCVCHLLAILRDFPLHDEFRMHAMGYYQAILVLKSKMYVIQSPQYAIHWRLTCHVACVYCFTCSYNEYQWYRVYYLHVRLSHMTNIHTWKLAPIGAAAGANRSISR